MKKQTKDVNQTFCLFNTGGHLWMKDYFDSLPLSVRRRLRTSRFNLCPWCLVEKVLPGVKRQHPTYSRERLLLIALERMERLCAQTKM
jgi:hypothetical protein